MKSIKKLMSFNNHKTKDKRDSLSRESLDSKHVVEEESKEMQVRIYLPHLRLR